MRNNEVKVLDLFCGAGGLSWGFKQLGFKVFYGVDNWKPAVDTFKANYPGAKVYQVNITKVSNDQLKKWFKGVSVVVGGPPCQGFSTAGKKVLDDPRNQLVKEFLRVIKVLLPEAFVFENVEGFVKFCKGSLLSELVEEFVKLGYDVAYGILNAVNYGVPQRRKRFFILGVRGRKPSLPKPTHYFTNGNGKTSFALRELTPAPTFWDAVSDLPLIESGERAEDYATPPQNEYQAVMRKECVKLTLHEAPKHKPHLIELIKYIPQGKSAFEVINEIPEELRPSSGFFNSYKRLRPDEPAPTITRNFTTPSSANCIHPFANRALTLREGARLQSFPDSYQFVGSFTDKRLLIGNAVPPLLSLAIAKEVAKSLGTDNGER